MVYEFTKSDEGKYFCYSIPLRGEDNESFHAYLYIIKVIDCVVACQCFVYNADLTRYDACTEGVLDINNTIDRLRKKQIEKRKKWLFKIIKTECDEQGLTHCYPLNLVVLNYFKPPNRCLTKRQRRTLLSFKSG